MTIFGVFQFYQSAAGYVDKPLPDEWLVMAISQFRKSDIYIILSLY